MSTPTPSGSTPDPPQRTGDNVTDPDESRDGLYGKFVVTKNGAPVTGCFVLRPGRDPAARVAMLAYAAATDNPKLRGDLSRWVREAQEAEAPDEQKAITLAIYEGMVANAAHDEALARRAAENSAFALEYARRVLTVAQEARP